MPAHGACVTEQAAKTEQQEQNDNGLSAEEVDQRTG